MRLAGFERRIYRTEPLIKLDDRSQLSFCHTSDFSEDRNEDVFFGSPSSYYTRLVHTCQVSHLTKEVLERNPNVPEKLRIALIIAAWIHDIGHPGYSHALEPITDQTHEEAMLGMIKTSELSGIIKDMGLSVSTVANLATDCKEYPAGAVISGPAGTDRLAYAWYDPLIAGRKTSFVFDKDNPTFEFRDKIVNSMRISDNGKVYFDVQGSVRKAELLIRSLYYLMETRTAAFLTIYGFPPNSKGTTLIMNAAELAKSNGHITNGDLFEPDKILLYKLLRCEDPKVSGLAKLVEDRKYPRTALAISLGVPDIIQHVRELKKQRDKRKAFEEKCGGLLDLTHHNSGPNLDLELRLIEDEKVTLRQLKEFNSELFNFDSIRAYHNAHITNRLVFFANLSEDPKVVGKNVLRELGLGDNDYSPLDGFTGRQVKLCGWN
jgi:hypothetical protein